MYPVKRYIAREDEEEVYKHYMSNDRTQLVIEASIKKDDYKAITTHFDSFVKSLKKEGVNISYRLNTILKD